LLDAATDPRIQAAFQSAWAYSSSLERHESATRARSGTWATAFSGSAFEVSRHSPDIATSVQHPGHASGRDWTSFSRREPDEGVDGVALVDDGPNSSSTNASTAVQELRRGDVG
jgi:hypothetical protein